MKGYIKLATWEDITKEFLEKELKIKKQCQIASELECDPSLLSKYKKKYIL